jgi:cytochrome c-type biogenesis protein CcmH
MAYFVDMRGEEILAAPPTRGFAITAWLFPILVIINGVGIIVLLTRRWTNHRSRKENVQTLSMNPSVSCDESSLNLYRDRLQKDLENFTT